MRDSPISNSYSMKRVDIYIKLDFLSTKKCNMTRYIASTILNHTTMPFFAPLTLFLFWYLRDRIFCVYSISVEGGGSAHVIFINLSGAWKLLKRKVLYLVSLHIGGGDGVAVALWCPPTLLGPGDSLFPIISAAACLWTRVQLNSRSQWKQM